MRPTSHISTVTQFSSLLLLCLPAPTEPVDNPANGALGSPEPPADPAVFEALKADVIAAMDVADAVLLAQQADESVPVGEHGVARNEPDYWEGRGLYLYLVRINPRTTCFSQIEVDIEAPPWPLTSADIYRTTAPMDGVCGEDY